MSLENNKRISSIGLKAGVAVTGLIMCGFIIAHLAGNLLIFAGEEAINAYAEGLRTFPLILWALRLGLIFSCILHIYLTIKLVRRNKAARPVQYQYNATVKASFASRTMVYSGLLLMFFIIFHLAHLTWRLTSPEIANFGHYDVYNMLLFTFQTNFVAVIFYVLAVASLGLHLSHGISSLVQTLGVTRDSIKSIIRISAPLIGLGISLLYMSIPLAIAFGIVR